MSFGLDYVDNALEEILKEVTNAGMIVFAAAGNHGDNGPRAFPGSLRNIICIHASDGKGKDGGISPQAITGSDNNLMTLGMSVPLIWKSREVVKSGTSFATPIAAGIAADVLVIARSFGLTKPEEQRLHSCDGMRQVFHLLSPTSDAGHRYVAPWKLWTPRRTEAMVRESILERLRS